MSNYKRVISTSRSSSSSSSTSTSTSTSCSNGLRGFRLYTKKLSIHRLRVRFMNWFRALNRFRKCYERAVRSLRKGLTSYRRRTGGKLRSDNGSCQLSKLILRGGERKSSECRLKSLARTNSFYTEAIADCLEFIKRNSLDHHPDLDDHDHHDDEAAPIAVAPLIR